MKDMNSGKKIKVAPVVALGVFITRFQLQLAHMKLERESRVEEWKKCCHQNFRRSLDYRSFFFKEVQKKHLQSKKQVEILQLIQQQKNKNTC